MQVETPTILIVDDEKSSRKILNDLLKEKGKIVLAKNGTQALELAAAQRPTLILMDILMPDMNGFQVLEKLKQSDDTKHIAVMFITALGSHNDETKGLRLGACDYVHKPFHAEIVQARVGTHLELAKQRRMLEELANLDALTSIPNRRQLEKKLDIEWANSVRTGEPLAIAMVDVDFFKLYNDEYGHASGDNVLRRIANILEAQLKRPRDLVYRYGGEEFCIILPDTESTGAQHILETCCKSVESLNIEHRESTVSPVVTISIGACICAPKAGESVEKALQQADQQLYQSKRQGRNQVHIKTLPEIESVS
ncbi:response regulator receiver-modulated signal transduction diguanylate cyclase [Oleiphilus messinensis]|uniref:diguanylate cyclase n=1 Tax=Oleiphilus messinensis TaxID=141451 RepID=A0A1Y0IFB4_9GAMM|nr:diguanylate cyclase [Oleiphilus messinensis]ARU58940.1 response regulator receiver-modulated signal transduction diguanylate cyclase [Oleiphilus messinensis]